MCWSGRALGLVGDLLGEVRAAAELLADDPQDVLGVRLVLAEEDRLRHLRAAGEDLGQDLVAEGADDRPDLVGGDDGAVELGLVVGDLVFELLVGLLARQPVADLDPLARADRRAASVISVSMR